MTQHFLFQLSLLFDSFVYILVFLAVHIQYNLFLLMLFFFFFFAPCVFGSRCFVILIFLCAVVIAVAAFWWWCSSPLLCRTELQNFDPECVVCQSIAQGSSVLQMGSNVCPTNWEAEYTGVVMASRYYSTTSQYYKKSQFICVDRLASGRPGSVDNSNGNLWYFAEVRCGALPCDVYPTGHEVTCARCRAPVTCDGTNSAVTGGLVVTAGCSAASTIGSTCTVACPAGEVLVSGDLVRTCQLGGTFAGEKPVCRPSSKHSGYTFTRWGRHDCPPTASLVYKGYVGGAYYTHAGSGYNRLCLHEKPVHPEIAQTGTSGANALVYGVEYETAGDTYVFFLLNLYASRLLLTFWASCH